MDFVTYEIGKKLQEKGYPHSYNRFGYRPIYSDECTIKYLSDIGAYEEEYYGENIPCPTIDEVLKWFRKEKGLHVEIRLFCVGYGFDIIRITDRKKLAWSGTDERVNYESAAIACIDYVLDNLI